MELLMLCIPAFAIFLASFFATVTGFGFGLIAVPLMSLVISVKVAIICGLIITVLLRIITMYNTRKIFSWDVVLTTVLGSALGMLPGSYMLKIISLAHLKIFLGCVLIMATYLM
ncbi:MAG: sulfite exporter TauE/SafE family protein, partial [Phascolarctobacterium sp.]|nr:sulfite exporter TauE/SafE family protein [Phascolarctobacterium sp.]